MLWATGHPSGDGDRLGVTDAPPRAVEGDEERLRRSPGEGDGEFVANYVKEVLAAREIACDGLKRLGIRFYPSRANFILFHAGDRAIPIPSTISTTRPSSSTA